MSVALIMSTLVNTSIETTSVDVKAVQQTPSKREHKPIKKPRTTLHKTVQQPVQEYRQRILVERDIEVVLVRSEDVESGIITGFTIEVGAMVLDKK